MSYNEDELEAPKWINGDFMKTVLDSCRKGENVKILDYAITPATARGDHYASIMFRANVDFSTDQKSNEHISLIIKTVPVVEGQKKEMIDSIDVFPREMHVYKEILGNCEDILKKSGCTERLAPNVLYMATEPYDVIVFEDLKEQGYIMLPRSIPNELECRLIYTKLAQYHALTFKLKADGSDNMNFRGTLYGYSIARKMPFFQTAPEFMTEALESVSGLETYASKMRQLTFDKLFEKGVETINRTAEINVLNHGDFHSRNMMFRKNAYDVISEVILVDFQGPHWGSPAFDILYIGAGMPPHLRGINIRHYFNVFIDTLIRCDYKGELPTFEQLENEIKAYKYIELFLKATISVFSYMNKGEIELGTLLSDNEVRRKMYRSEAYLEHLKETIPALLDQIEL